MIYSLTSIYLHNLGEDKKATAFWTIMSKTESKSLARNIKCKGREEEELEKHKGRKSI